MNNEVSAIHKIVAIYGVVSENNQNYTVHNFSPFHINLSIAMSEL